MNRRKKDLLAAQRAERQRRAAKLEFRRCVQAKRCDQEAVELYSSRDSGEGPRTPQDQAW
eukprot:scaffold1166_cov261-Pinguiococcus_pyrenoidosus.AAC.56